MHRLGQIASKRLDLLIDVDDRLRLPAQARVGKADDRMRGHSLLLCDGRTEEVGYL
jgi:hypothetical protein